MTFCFPLDKLAYDSCNVAAWHLHLLLPQWCFVLPLCGGVIRHTEMWIQFKCFIVNDWENLQEEFFLWGQALSANSNIIPFPQHDPPIHKHLLRNLALGCAWEYSWATHVSKRWDHFLSHPTSSNTTLALTTLHLKSNGYFPFYFLNYEPYQDLELSSNSFKLAFEYMPHLSASGHYGMVF